VTLITFLFTNALFNPAGTATTASGHLLKTYSFAPLKAFSKLSCRASPNGSPGFTFILKLLIQATAKTYLYLDDKGITGFY